MPPIPSSGKHQSNITHTYNHAYHYDNWDLTVSIVSRGLSAAPQQETGWLQTCPALISVTLATNMHQHASFYICKQGWAPLARPFDPCTPLLSSHGASPHLCYQKHSHLSFIHSHTNFHGYRYSLYLSKNNPGFSLWGFTINSLTRIDEDISDIFWAAGIFLCLDQLLPDSHHCSGSLDLK